MKTAKLIIIFFLSLFMFSCSKEPTDKVLNPLDVNEINNLEVLCQVWGLVKYHHPAFKKGSNLDADADLLELIPKIREANVKTRNQILLDWITGLGTYNSSKASFDSKVNGKKINGQTAKPDIIVDVFWIENEQILGTKLSAELVKVRYAATSEGSKYLEMEDSVISFLEKEYTYATEPSPEYRILALFRYWNIIEYFYPLKIYLPRHWNNVLADHIPKFLGATGNLEYRKAIARLVAETGDSAFNYGHIAFVFGNRMVHRDILGVSVVENKLIATSASSTEFQIKVGDEIVSIGGRSLSDIKSLIHEYLSCSNQGMLHSFVSNYALATNNSTLSVTYLSDGELKTEVFPTEIWLTNPVEFTTSTPAISTAYSLVEGGIIGYINGAYYVASEAATMMNALKNTRGIIIDLRGYLKDFSMTALAYNYFTNVDVFCFDYGTPDPSTPGILYRYYQSNAIYGYFKNYMTYNGKVVILADETTFGGEHCIVLLQTIPGAITIGSQTRGGMGQVSIIVFPGNISYPVSCKHTYTGYDVQRNGVRIDIEVKPTIAGIKAGRDELYEKAVELILK